MRDRRSCSLSDRLHPGPSFCGSAFTRDRRSPLRSRNQSEPRASRASSPSGRLRRVIVALLPAGASAFLLYLSYPLPAVSWLAWVALVPWAVQVLRARRGRVALYTWPIWLAWWAIMVHWVRFATVLGWLALVVYLSVYFPAAAVLLRLLNGRLRLPTTIGLPVVWVGLEHLRARLLTGFPWFFLGHTQYAHPALIQIADLVGVSGISFVVAAVKRDMELFIAHGDTRVEAGDTVYAVLREKDLDAFLDVYGFRKRTTGRIFVFGATTVGSTLCAELEDVVRDIAAP